MYIFTFMLCAGNAVLNGFVCYHAVKKFGKYGFICIPLMIAIDRIATGGESGVFSVAGAVLGGWLAFNTAKSSADDDE